MVGEGLGRTQVSARSDCGCAAGRSFIFPIGQITNLQCEIAICVRMRGGVDLDVIHLKRFRALEQGV